VRVTEKNMNKKREDLCTFIFLSFDKKMSKSSAKRRRVMGGTEG
jgi:hypothetical protein